MNENRTIAKMARFSPEEWEEIALVLKNTPYTESNFLRKCAVYVVRKGLVDKVLR